VSIGQADYMIRDYVKQEPDSDLPADDDGE
jgi:hypothetical protein